MEAACKAGKTVWVMVAAIQNGTEKWNSDDCDLDMEMYLDMDASVTFSGKHFVLSGFSFTYYENDVIAAIEKRGGIIHRSMVKAADYLVVNLRDPGMSKIKKALEWRQKGATNLIVSDYQMWQAIFRE